MEILAPLLGAGVHGARAYVESRPGVGAATATSDNGEAGVDMCNLPTFGAQKVIVIKAGWTPVDQAVTLGGLLTVVQFNMHR